MYRSVVAAVIGLAVSVTHSLAAQSTRSGRVDGVAFDSVAMRPLSGAIVQAVQVANPIAAKTVTADSLGRFVLTGLKQGPWAVAAMHPRLDSLGLDQIRATFTVHSGLDASVVVAIPGARRLARLLCGEPTLEQDTSGFFVGTLRTATADRRPVEGEVRVNWLELTITPRGFVRTRETRTTRTGPDGRFVACGVPAGGVVQVSATRSSDSSGVLDLQMPIDGIQQRDLYVGTSRLLRVPRAATEPDSTRLSDGPDSLGVRRGDGRLRGRVVGSNGAPLANARVAIRDAGVDVRSDDAGRFALANLPTGTWNLDIRAVGHEPLTRPVDIVEHDSATLAYTMSRLVVADTFRIRATMSNGATTNMAAFEERRKAGFGRYLGPEELNKLEPLLFSDIMLRFPALRLQRADWGYVITMRATGMAARCAPRIYVDNVLTPNDGSLDSFLMASQISAVEVYAGSMGPPQYMDALSGCGSILVWTGPRTTVNARR